MPKKDVKDGRDVGRLVSVLLIDDKQSDRERIKEVLQSNTTSSYDLNIVESSNMSEIAEHLKEGGSYDLIIVDISFGRSEGDSKGSLYSNSLNELLDQRNKANIIVYSKHLPDTWSLARLKHKADVLCVGPDREENTFLAAKRAYESLFEKRNPAADKLQQRWKTFCQLTNNKKKGLEFESICAKLLSDVEGFRVTRFDPGRSEKKADLIIDNRNNPDFWIQSLGNPILVECKIGRIPSLLPMLYELVGRLTITRAKTGILFLAFPLSESDKLSVSEITKAVSADGKHILVIDVRTLEAAIKGKYPDTVLKLAYFSSLAYK